MHTTGVQCVYFAKKQAARYLLHNGAAEKELHIEAPNPFVSIVSHRPGVP